MSNKIMLVENERVLHNDKEVAQTKNKYFSNITKTLRLRPFKKYDTDDIDLLTSQFDDYASIKNQKYATRKQFLPHLNLLEVSMEDVKKQKLLN